MICAESQEEEKVISQTDSYVLTPWQREPYGLISWWDMEQFQLDNLSTVILIIERMRHTYEIAVGPGDPLFAPKDFPLTEKQRLDIAQGIPMAMSDLRAIGLNNSADCLRDLALELNATRQMKVTSKTLLSRFEEFQRAMRREMQSHLFLYVPPDQAAYYQKPRAGWEEAIVRFPSAIVDIEECSRCFACDRWAAAVFHAVSVAEHGVIEFGKVLQLNDPKPGWQSVSREVDKILNRTKYSDLLPLHQQHFKLIEQVSPLMIAMNDAWRNKIGHVANRLILMTGEMNDLIAKDIIRTSQSFMRRLAIDLPSL